MLWFFRWVEEVRKMSHVQFLDLLRSIYKSFLRCIEGLQASSSVLIELLDSRLYVPFLLLLFLALPLLTFCPSLLTFCLTASHLLPCRFSPLASEMKNTDHPTTQQTSQYCKTTCSTFFLRRPNSLIYCLRSYFRRERSSIRSWSCRSSWSCLMRAGRSW